MVIVPSLHPAYLLRSGEAGAGQTRFNQTVSADIAKANRLLLSEPTWNEAMIHERDASGRPVALYPTLQEVYSFVRLCLLHGETLAIDIETTGKNIMDAKLMCVGFACRYWDGRETVLCVPVRRQGGSPYWSDDEWPLIWELVRDLLASAIRKVFQNLGFDTVGLKNSGWLTSNLTADTLQSHHIVDAELPHDLGYLGTRYLDLRYWKSVKGEKAFIDIDDTVFRTYNLRDALATLRLQPILEQEVHNQGSWDLYQEEIKLARLMSRATERGLMINEQRFAEYGKLLTTQRDDAITRFRAIVPTGHDGKPLDLNRPNHVFHALFTALGFPVVKKTDTGAPSTDKDALVALALVSETRAQREGLQALADFRTSDKMRGTIEGFPLVSGPYGRRLHPSWGLRAVTGRFTTSPNAQNWNKATKKMFQASPGCEFVGVDLSQAELRGVAYLANDKFLLNMLEHGINIHTVNCALFFKVRCREDHKDLGAKTAAYLKETLPDYMTYPVLDDSRWHPTRVLSKNMEFGSQYRAEADALHRVLRSKRDPDTNKPLFPTLDLSLVEGLLAKKKSLRTDLVAWWHRVHEQSQKRGYAICPISGRRRFFRAGFKTTETANWPVQTLVASHVNKAMLRIQDRFDAETGGAALIVQQVHDALNCETPLGYGARAGVIMREEFGRPLNIPPFENAKLPADAAQIGQFLDEV